MALLPPGEGGGLLIRAPRALCAVADHEFHLHKRVESNGIRFVAELEADRSPCEWRFDNLPEGEYEALIQVESTGRTVARQVGQVIRAETRIIDLQSMQLRVQGFVTSEGRPRPDLVLQFRPDGPGWGPEGNVAIGQDGQYEVMLGDPSRGAGWNKYCATLSAKKSANHLSTCRELSGQWDFDVAPGAIQVVVPPFSTGSGAQWAHVSLHLVRTHASPADLVRTGGSATFKSREGFRGTFIGVPYGEFTITLSEGDNQSGATKLSTAPVTLTARDPLVELTFSVR